MTKELFFVRFCAIAFCILSVFSSAKTYAWNAVGHQVTAYIAWQRMTPETRERVFRILMNAPEDSHLNTVYDRFNGRSEETKRLEQFMYASYWSDVVRNRNFENRHKKYNQGNWHYAAIFWKQENGEARILKDFKGSGGIAVPKLKDFERIMSDSSFPDSEKALAIAWFLHVAGDLHNPVHNASRVTEQEPEGDQGGNLFVFRERTETQRRINLHGYWDSIVSTVRKRKNDQCDVSYVTPIAEKFMKKHKFKKLESRLNLSDYDGWNKEGFSYLNKFTYNDIERGKMPSKKYEKRTFKLSREQLTLAGYRIGETFNRIFATPKGVSLNQCRKIRRVLYPVSKRRTPEQKMRPALITICPTNLGLVARPLISLDPQSKGYEYEVIRTFENEKEAKDFAKRNRIADVVL